MTTGAAITTSAITIAPGVYMRPSPPRMPLRHRRRATNRPATTGGRAIPVFTTLSTTWRDRNRDRASHVPMGSPMSRLISVAAPETASDSSVISTRSLLTTRLGLTSRGPGSTGRRAHPPRSGRRSGCSLRLPGVGDEELHAELVHAEVADDLLAVGGEEEVGERRRRPPR